MRQQEGGMQQCRLVFEKKRHRDGDGVQAGEGGAEGAGIKVGEKGQCGGPTGGLHLALERAVQRGGPASASPPNVFVQRKLWHRQNAAARLSLGGGGGGKCAMRRAGFGARYVCGCMRQRLGERRHGVTNNSQTKVLSWVC